MVELLAACGIAALALAAWKAAAAVATAATHGHALPPVPAALAESPSHVDVMRPFFVTSHGLALFVRKWLPPQGHRPRGVIFLAHGLGEHGGRYEHLARVLAGQHALAVFAVDHQGHGLSDGERMYARKLAHLAEDLDEFVAHVLSGGADARNRSVIDAAVDPHADVDWSTLPRFLFGHSMGGVVALQVAERSLGRRDWDGVILSSPAIYCSGNADGSYAPFIVTLARWLPKMKLPPIAFHVLGNDVDVYNRWARDPLRPHHGATLSLSVSLVTEGHRFSRKGGSPLTENGFPWPLYIVHGDADTLTLPLGSATFLNLAKSGDKDEKSSEKTLKLIPGAVHETLNLEGHEDVLQDIVRWIEKHL